MQIVIKGKNVEVTEALRSYVLKKVQRADRYFNNIQDALITLSMERGRFKAEVTMQISGATLRAEEREGDMYSAIDRMADKLERQVKRHKEKLTHKGKIPPEESWVPSADALSAESEARIVRVKKYALKPMSAEEAVEEMELLGHDFFVYRNTTSNQVNVVYKRKDGHYGLIEPEPH